MFWSDTRNSLIAMATLDGSNSQVLANVDIDIPGEYLFNSVNLLVIFIRVCTVARMHWCTLTHWSLSL